MLDFFESQEIASREGIDNLGAVKIEKQALKIEKIVLKVSSSVFAIESSVVRTIPRTMEIRRSSLAGKTTVYEDLNKDKYKEYIDIYNAMKKFKVFKLSDLINKFGDEAKYYFESLVNHGILLAKGDGEDRRFTMNPSSVNHIYDNSKTTRLYFASWLVSQENLEYENFYSKISGNIIFLSANSVFYNGEIMNLEKFQKEFLEMFAK